MEAEAGGHRRGWIPGGGAFVGTGLGAGKVLGCTMSTGQSGGAAVSGEGAGGRGQGLGGRRGWTGGLVARTGKILRLKPRYALLWPVPEASLESCRLCKQRQDQIHLLERKFSAVLWGLREAT